MIMEIKIDFSNKRIEVLSQIEIGELIKNLKKMFPSNWKEFTIVQSHHSYPVYVRPWYYRQPVINTPIVYTEIRALSGTTFTATNGSETLNVSAN